MSRFIAIDADAGGLFVASGFAKGGAIRIEQAVASFDDARPLSALTAPEIATRLKALLAEARIPNAPVLVCLGRDRVVFKDVRHPKTAPADEPAVVRFQSLRELTESPDDVHMDYMPVPNPGADDCRATVVFVRKDLYNAAKTLCELAGLKLAGVTPRPFASAALTRSAIAHSIVPPPDDPAGAVGVLSVWDGGGEFVVYRGEQLLLTRTLPASALVSEQALVGEVKRSVAAMATQHPKSPIQAVYLAEGHSSGGSWSARLQSVLPMPVYPLDPLAGGPTAVPPHLRGRFLGPAGLLAGRSAGNLPINFVTPRQPRAEPNKTRIRGILGLILLLGIGATLGAVGYLMHTDLDKKILAQRDLKTQVEEDIKAQKVNTNRIAAVDDFKSRDVVWADVLYDIAAVYPDINKMRLKEFRAEIDPPKVEVKKAGQTSSLLRPGGTAPTGGLRPAGTVVAAPKPVDKPVGKLKLVVVAGDDLLPNRLKDVFEGDQKAYQKPDVKYPTLGGRSSDLQEYTVLADVLKRKPVDYTRKIDAKLPVVKLPPAPAQPVDPIDPDDQEQP